LLFANQIYLCVVYVIFSISVFENIVLGQHFAKSLTLS